MNTNLHKLFKSHAEWLESEGESGEQLVLENISSKQLTKEQLQLLTDSVLTECAFVDTELNRIDLYHTEMYSCEFDRSSFHKVQLIKSEVNDTDFTDTRFDSVSFSNAEMFDCIFTGCTFDNSTFISVGIWNATFDEYTFTNVDFESAYIENAIFVNSKFINPINLEKATLLLYNGTDLKTVQERLGHADLTTTNKYLHLVEQADVEAVNSLETLLTVSKSAKSG